MPTDKQTGNNGRDDSGQFAAGNAGGPGRPKGSTNRFTAVKLQFLNVLEAAGGEEFILAFAKAEPAKFLAIVGRMLPATTSEQENTVRPVIPVQEVVVHSRAEAIEFTEWKRRIAEGNGEAERSA